jgi:hypothetical protein
MRLGARDVAVLQYADAVVFEHDPVLVLVCACWVVGQRCPSLAVRVARATADLDWAAVAEFARRRCVP